LGPGQPEFKNASVRKIPIELHSFANRRTKSGLGLGLDWSHLRLDFAMAVMIEARREIGDLQVGPFPAWAWFVVPNGFGHFYGD